MKATVKPKEVVIRIFKRAWPGAPRGCAMAALLLLLLGTVNAAAQSPRVRIPGVIKRSPIEFSADIASVERPALLEAQAMPNKDGIPAGQRVHGVSFNTSEKPKVTDTKFFELLNPTALTTIGTPIPMEAEIIVVNSKTQQAKVGNIVPDSVAAWKRLKTWPDLKKAFKAEDLATIDESAGKVSDAATAILRNGKMTREDEEKLIECYNSLSSALGSAYDKTSNFDIQRQFSNAIAGVRAERVAWSQVLKAGVPILNPTYAPDAGETPPKSSGSLPNVPDAPSVPAPPTSAPMGRSAEAVLKSGDMDGDGTVTLKGLATKYKGYESLQALRPTKQFLTMYQQARACVAICEGTDEPFATGTIIGKNLILTCAHAVARTGRGGSPAAKDRRRLMIKIGHDFPEDPGTPQTRLVAKIVFEGKVQDTPDSDPLDFALLTADISGKYDNQNAQTTETAVQAYLANPSLENKRKCLAQMIMPIEPLPLANFDVTEADTFNIAGHPEGAPKLICNNGKILYPLYMEEAQRDELSRTLISGASTPTEAKALKDTFAALYQLKDWPDRDNTYRYCYGNFSPGIGVICATVGGNSGSAAVLKGHNRPGIIGVLVEGQPGRSEPWIPAIDRHERLLPITTIIRQLNEKFKREIETLNGQKPGPLFPEPTWYRHYGVTLLERQPTGELTPQATE